jgi:hypothetical protein
MNPKSKRLPGLLLANSIRGSLITKLFEECVTVLPVTFKLPVIFTSPDIVPPLELYLVLAVMNAELAYTPDVTALWSAVAALVVAVFDCEYAELAYELAETALVVAVFA